MSLLRWRKTAAAATAVALTFVAPPGSATAVDQGDGDGPGDTLPADLVPNPYEGLDLSDPLAARDEVQRRLGESAAASDVLAELIEVTFTEVVAAEQRSIAAVAWLETAREEAAAANDAAERAEKASTEAAREALEARAAAREALVDAYMTPPVGDSTRVLVSVTDINDSFFIHGVLTSRAENLTELLDAADRADRAAAAAAAAASRAVVSAEAAASEATAATAAAAAAAEEIGERLADLQLFVAMVEAQVESLAAVDALLEQVVAQREASAAAAAGPPVGASEVSAVGGTTIRVHRSVVAAVSLMVADAATDGVVLDGYGWRTVESQIALRHAHCGSSPDQVYLVSAASCSPPTARPGSSMHERGLAIDFSNCGARSTACYQWLAEHAHRYGFFNLPSEPWHWSVNGN